MLNNVKIWVMAFLGALATALGIYVKILHEQKDTLEEKVKAKDKELKEQEAHLAEKDRAEEQSDKQNDLLVESEVEKAKAGDDAKKTLDDSETKDITDVM